MTKLDIWNAALALIPHDVRIESESEASTEAARCREQWDGARRSVLSAREWGWLVREDAIPCGPSPYGVGWRYPRPSGALAVIGLVTPDGHRAHSSAVNGSLQADAPGLRIRYLEDSETPDDWPVAIVDAITAELAARICPPFTANPQRSAELRMLAASRLTEAGRLDAMETAYDGSDPDVFIKARL